MYNLLFSFDIKSFFKNGSFPASFLYIFVFSKLLTVNKVQHKFCTLVDLNHGPLVSEATALPTESQTQPIYLSWGSLDLVPESFITMTNGSFLSWSVVASSQMQFGRSVCLAFSIILRLLISLIFLQNGLIRRRRKSPSKNISHLKFENGRNLFRSFPFPIK